MGQKRHWGQKRNRGLVGKSITVKKGATFSGHWKFEGRGQKLGEGGWGKS